MNAFIVIGCFTIAFVLLQSVNTVFKMPEKLYIGIHVADILMTVVAMSASILLSKYYRNSWLSIYSFSGVLLSWWPLWAIHLIRLPSARKKGVLITGVGGVLTLVTAVLLIQGGYALAYR